MNQEELISKLQEADKAYYDLDSPIIPDYEYDRLVLEYELLTGIRWMFQGSSGTVKHKRPMVSLLKVRTVEELVKFLPEGNPQLYVMPKIDGGGLSLWYDKNGYLTRAVTRGKLVAGESYGEDVTKQVRLIPSVLQVIDPLGFPAEIRGEVWMSEDDLEWANQIRESEGKEPFKNTRNAATGILRNESQGQYLKYLTFTPYEIFDQSKPHHEDKNFDSFFEKVEFLQELGFNSFEVMHLTLSTLLGLDHDENDLPLGCTTREEYTLVMLEEYLGNVDEPNDGVVIMLDDLNLCRSLGYARTHPNFGVAFKFATETAETTIREIQWTATRTGRIVPKAIFDPVDLDGTTVGQATLHNAKNVIDMNYEVGDVVEAWKANMIIPQIGKIISKKQP